MKILTFAAVMSLSFAHAPAHAGESRAETEHLIIEWSEGTTDEEILAAQTRGEAFYAEIAAMIKDRPPAKITILLQGNAERPNGRWEHPRVDPFGRILLFKFGPGLDSYFNALAHEMVHALRIGRARDADWFFEEGLAEFIALRVDSSLGGFPWYDTPMVVAAGQWIASGEDIALADLRARHQELNLPCRAQAYSLRSAFFDWLGQTQGDAKVLEMASAEKAGAVEDYQRVFGTSFDTLAATWRAALLTSFNAVPDAAAKAAAYRTQTPVQYIPVCGGANDE